MSHISAVPPYSNRGAQNTNGSGLIACVDWLQVTFLHATSAHEIVALLGLQIEKFTDFDTGKYGYPCHLRLGHIAIYYSNEKVGVHLEITGQGCREYEMLGKYEWSVLFGLILMNNVNITRLDLAIDDYHGYFKIATIYRKLKSGHASSLFKSFRYMVQARIASKEITGQTVYLGSPQSRLMVRFYDKLAERKNKNFEIKDGVTCWNRTELQLRDERAMSAAVLLSTEKYETGKLVAGILKNYINFLNPTKTKTGSIDKNKSRWNVAKFWDEFLGQVEPLGLTEKAPDKTIETTKSWFDKNMTATFAMLFKAFEYDESLLEEWIKTGEENFSKRHENMLKQFFEFKQSEAAAAQERRTNKLLDNMVDRFEIDKNGQVRLAARRNTVENTVRDIVEIDSHEYDSRLIQLFKEKYDFRIRNKKESEPESPNS